MEPRTPAAGPASVERVAVIEVVVAEIVPIDDRPAVGDVGVVVVNHPMAVPIASPVMPTPTIPSEETNAEPDSKSNPRSGQEDPRLGIPAWIRDDGLAVHEPGIIGRHVHLIRSCRLDDNRVPLSRYLLLVAVIQMAGFLSLLTHHLDSIHHVLLLVGICVSK